MTEPMPEFSPVRTPAPLGDPSTDRPGTWRMEGPDTWERRYDPTTRRVVKTARGRWAVITGEPVLHHDWERWALTDAEVTDYPYTNFLVVQVAMRDPSTRTATPAAVAGELASDEDEKPFR